MKYKIDKTKREMFAETDEGKVFLEYHDATGGQPIGLYVPFGYPKGVEEMGGVIPVYKECIKKGVTWEELLDFKEDDDVNY